MDNEFQIEGIFELPPDIEELRAEAAKEEFSFMDRLVAEWDQGTNRFNKPGEILLGAFLRSRLVAVAGLNHDPYADQPGIGRLRHLYVRQSVRRLGVGSVLVRRLLDHAQNTFHSVRLRTATPEAASFYVQLGFHPVDDNAATHIASVRKPMND